MENELIKMISDISSSIDWSAWVTAIATLILAILTFIYVKLTRRILSSQSDPCVVLTVVHDENRPTILQLVVKNVGTGIAYDVHFGFSQPIPAKAWGLTTDKAKQTALMNDGPLINGIPALGPGESRKIDWGQFGGRLGREQPSRGFSRGKPGHNAACHSSAGTRPENKCGSAAVRCLDRGCRVCTYARKSSGFEPRHYSNTGTFPSYGCRGAERDPNYLSLSASLIPKGGCWLESV